MSLATLMARGWGHTPKGTIKFIVTLSTKPMDCLRFATRTYQARDTPLRYL